MNRNAYSGRNVEILFRNSIGDYPTVINAIQSAYSIKGTYRTSINSGIHAEKRDVTLEFNCGRNIDANVKSYGAMAYNQLTRTSIDNFCKRFNLPFGNWLKALFIEKAKNASSMLFTSAEQSKAVVRFQPIAKEIVEWSLSLKSSREILALFDKITSEFRIYKMKDVLKHNGYDVGFTNRGNMTIGKFVMFQRKGGNGKRCNHIKKDDVNHPGNNVQLKLKIKPFIVGMNPFALAKYVIDG